MEGNAMDITRRGFLKTGAVGLTALVLPRGIIRRAYGATTNPVLVVLYLRGGADGLNLVVPTFDPLYYTNRENIKVPEGDEFSLDDGFGLNPALGDLLPLYQSGELAIIHASGSHDPSRSHFDAQDFMERAAPGDKSIADGWLNRYLAVAGGGAAISGITLAKQKAKAMLGDAPSLAFAGIDAFALSGDYVPERRDTLEVRYEFLPGTLLGGAVTDALGALDVIGGVDTSTSVVYPSSSLGSALKDTAALIKADVGARVIAIDLGGWDHHSDEVARIGVVGGDLAASLAAFYQDLGSNAAMTLTLCMTEFGRRVAENGGLGTDHGHGGIMFALGGGIAGSRVILKDGAWPGLAPENLYNGQDLPVTTDFREIFAEVLNRHMLLNLSEMAPIFPGFSVDAGNFPGLYT
jgi:uncharacterized protein (DUF1501 family)